MIHMNIPENFRKNQDILVGLGEQCGDVSLQCSDIAGALNQLNGAIQDDVVRLEELQQIMGDLTQNQTESGDAAQQLRTTALSATVIIAQCHQAASASLNEVAALVQQVTGLETELRAFLPIIETVGGISDELRDIAKKTRMLGFNATIEAARGGEATRSFGVVADEIRRLAERADASAGSVGEKLSDLDRQARILIGGVEANIEQGRNTGAHIDELRSSMDMISGLVDEFHHRSTAIADCTDDASRDVDMLRAGLDRFGETAVEHARQLDQVRERVDGLEGFANDIFNSTAHAGLETRDSCYIRYGLQGADEVARLITNALESGGLVEGDLFDVAYETIADSDPKQYLNRFVAFADSRIRALLDAHTAQDAAIVGCCLVDMNGYLPTHISAKSKPQRSGERLWNLENARNRQIFMDSQTRRALDSDGEYFLYTYRQDFGDGRYRALRSVLVPLSFKGRRWGLYELGYLI